MAYEDDLEFQQWKRDRETKLVNDAEFEQWKKDRGYANPFLEQPKQEQGGFKAAFKQALGSQVQGVGQLASDLGWDDNAIESYGKSVQQANPTTVHSLGDIVEHPWQAFKEGTGMALGYLAPGVVGRGLQVVGGAAKLAGLARAGAALNSMPAQAGMAALPSYGGIREDQEAEGHNDWSDKALAALGAGAVGAIETGFGAQRAFGIGRGANAGALPTKAEFVKQLGATPWRTAGKAAGRTIGEEMGEELVQNPIEQLAAYQNPTSAENINETLTGAALAGMGTLGLGGFGGARMGLRHNQINQRMEQDLLNPEQTPLGDLRESAEWKQAFMNRDGEAGDHWYDELMRDQFALRNQQVYDAGIEQTKDRIFAGDGNKIPALDRNQLALPAPVYEMPGSMPEQDAAFANSSEAAEAVRRNEELWAARDAEERQRPRLEGFAKLPAPGQSSYVMPAEGSTAQVDLMRLGTLEGRAQATSTAERQNALLAEQQDNRPISDGWNFNAQNISVPQDLGSAIGVLRQAVEMRRANQPIVSGSDMHQALLEADSIVRQSGYDPKQIVQHYEAPQQTTKGTNAPQTQQVAPQAVATPAAQTGTQQTAAPAAQGVAQQPASRLDAFKKDYGVSRKDARIATFLNELDKAKAEGQLTDEEHKAYEQKLADAWKVKDTKKSKNAVAAHNAMAKEYVDFIKNRAVAPSNLTDEEKAAAGWVKKITVKGGAEHVEWIPPKEKRVTEAAQAEVPRVDPEDIENPEHEKAVRMHLAGDNLRTIAATLGKSHETWRKVLLDYGYDAKSKVEEDSSEAETGSAFTADENAAYNDDSTHDETTDANPDVHDNDEYVDNSLENQGINIRSAGSNSVFGRDRVSTETKLERQQREEREALQANLDSSKAYELSDKVANADVAAATELLGLLNGSNGLMIAQQMRAKFAMPASVQTPQAVVEFIAAKQAAAVAAHKAQFAEAAEHWGEGFDTLPEAAKLDFVDAMNGLGDLINTPAVLRQIKGEIQNEYLHGQAGADAAGVSNSDAQRPAGGRNDEGSGTSGANQKAVPVVSKKKRRVAVADEAAGRSDSEGQAGEVDGKLYRRETLVFTDSTGQHFSEEVESIDIRNTEDLLNALDDVAYNQLSGTLDYVSGFHATDSLDAYAYPNGDGTYKIVLPRALLSGHPETLTRVLHHELGHVADAADAINGGKNSSGIAMGVMVQKAKALYDKLPANSKLKKHLEYPFHSKYPESGSAKMQRTELYAQLVSAYLDPELSAELRAVHPTLFNFAESIVNEIEEQYQEDAESSDAGVSPSRVVHQGNHAVVRQRGAAAQQDPAYGKAKTLVKQLLETVGDYFQSAENALLFGHNLAEKAKSLIPGANKYFESVRNKQVERVRQEEQIAAIAEAHYALSEAEQAKVNKFLDESTSQEKWGYQPDWVKTNVVDAAMAQRFNALSPEAQKVVKGVFKFGAEQQERFDKAVNDNLDPKDRVTRRQMYAKPYAPLKRFGDHVVVGKSAAYIKEKARLQAEGKTTSKSLEDLQADPNHYYVEFVDSDFEAIRRRDALAAANPNMTWDKKPLQKEDRLLNATSFSMLKKLQNQIGGMDANKKTKAALESLANQLYVAQLNRLHANKSQMSRKGVKGYDQDMMRAFVSQGRAEAALIANLKTHAEAEGALQLISNAAREGSNQDRKTRMANAVMTRHLALLNYKSTPIQDLLLKTNSVYFLLTSPAYYLTNATQPFVISLPYMSAKFGGAKSWGALVDSYKIAFGMTKLFKDNKLDAAHLKKFDSVGRESDALQTLIDENLVNIGMEMELGDIVNRSKVPGFKQLDATVGKMRSVVGNVEKLNRLSSAAAAYRLAYTEARNAGKDLDAAHEAGTAYARDVIQKTHGDYSGYNAPTLMMQGAYGNLPVKTLLQFKKFQFIQFGLLAGAAKQAFAGSSVEERALGRKVLGYILGTQMALAGMVGIPLLSGVIPAILTAAFGDDGEDKEEFIRRMLGGGTLAQLVTHGVPAAMGLDISKRVGMGNVADPFRFMDGQTKPADWALSLAGPSAGLASRFWQGMDYMRKGEYWKGAEFMVPNGIANASKALRFETTGVTNSRGDVVMKPEEIGFFDDVFQALGLPTTTMTDRQWATGVLSNKDHYFKEQASKIKHDYVEATRSGEGVAEARQAWMELQAARVRQGFERQKMSDLTNAPKEQAKRERNVVDGIQFTKTNQAAAKMIAEL